MIGWKTINILDVIDNNDYNTFFNEKYGLITHISIDIDLVDENGGYIANGSNGGIFYVNKKENGDTYFEKLQKFDIKTMFETEFYIIKSEWQRYFNYNSISKMNFDHVKLLKDYKYKAIIRYGCIGYTGNSAKLNIIEQHIVIISSTEDEFKDQLKDYTFFATKNSISKYSCPIFMDLKKNQKYYYVGKGICIVNEVYDWNGENSPICNVSFLDETSNFDILPSDIRFVEIPMDHKNEFDIFQESLNEVFLQPIIKTKCDQNLINVIWQPIDDAARYIIKLYKTINERGKKRVYFLNDYDIERNKCWFDIPNIIIDDHIVVIIAENRSGEIIAKSKGVYAINGKVPYDVQ